MAYDLYTLQALSKPLRLNERFIVYRSSTYNKNIMQR